ncbi:MAG: diaminopropionate ammonia-lyase [Coprococcus sp.]|nr:diaminopropionate ammonia-lyase [Coprococcus sp.]
MGNVKRRYYMDIYLQDSVKGAKAPNMLNEEAAQEVAVFHKGIPEYRETPLVYLEDLSKELKVKGIYIKDESTRFGLKAFKGLGGTYAMFRILCRELGLDPKETEFLDFQKPEIKRKTAKITFVTATDGNHGKGVSWAAGLFGCRAYVFMPEGSSKSRAQAIRDAGPAEVEIRDTNYDKTVEFARTMSEENGWFLIQDTAWDGYEEVPWWIIQGYLTMAQEAVRQIERRNVRPTHVFLQAGVGAMAGTVAGYAANYYGEYCPVISLVEPEEAACFFLSAKQGDGGIHSTQGNPRTIMAGLNCGTPCKNIWPILRDGASGYFACPDFVAAHGMRTYAFPSGKDEKIISGESGASTLGLVSLLLKKEELLDVKEALGLDEDSEILLFNTEGDTDPDCYRRVVEEGAYPVPE